MKSLEWYPKGHSSTQPPSLGWIAFAAASQIKKATTDYIQQDIAGHCSCPGGTKPTVPWSFCLQLHRKLLSGPSCKMIVEVKHTQLRINSFGSGTPWKEESFIRNMAADYGPPANDGSIRAWPSLMAFHPVEGKAVAVIGGGIAGVVAAQTLSAQHEVLGGASGRLGWGRVSTGSRRRIFYQLNHTANKVAAGLLRIHSYHLDMLNETIFVLWWQCWPDHCEHTRTHTHKHTIYIYIRLYTYTHTYVYIHIYTHYM